MTFGTEVGFSAGDFVLDKDPAPSPKRGRRPLPNFPPVSIAAGCIKMPLGMDLGLLSPGDFVLHGDQKRGEASPNFRPMFIVAKRLDGLRWHLAWR